MKKFLLAIPMTIMLGLSMMFMSACNETPTDNRTFVANQTVKTQTEAIVNNIVDNVYNNTETFGSKNTYSVEQVKEKLTQFEYYVEVGSVSKFGEIKTISLNGTEFSADETLNSFNLSVGYKNFIQDKIFYEKEGKLYVAAPIIAYESSVSSKLTINDKEVDLGTGVNTSTLNIESIGFMAKANSTIQPVENKTNEYDLTIKESDKWVQITYTGMDDSDVFLTKKVTDGQPVSYGLTGLDNKDGTSQTEKVFAFYPIDYGADITTKSVRDKFDGKTRDYYIYCIGKGSAKLKLNINIYQEPENK